MPEARAVYQLSKKDLLQAQIRHAGSFSRILQTLGVLMLCGGMFGLLKRPPDFATVGLLLPGLYLTFAMRFSVERSFKRDFSKHSNTEFVASPSRVEFINAIGSADLSWAAFTRYLETKDLFMLYAQSSVFHIIPKRGFAAEDLLFARQLIQENLGAKSAIHNKKISPGMLIFSVVLAVVGIVLALAIVNIRR